MAGPVLAPLLLLPGGIMPGHLRYGPLVQALGPDVRTVIKELEIYAGPSVPDGWSVDTEVDGISRAAEQAGITRFHLYGHSGGGAFALAYVARHPERVVSLALDEPATDFSEQETAAIESLFQRMRDLPPEESMAEFFAASLRPGVQMPASPAGPTPAWMANRPAGLEAMSTAFRACRVRREAWRAFSGPVYYSYGSLSAVGCELMRDRLASYFPDFTSERYEGLHHFHTSHMAEPDRVAAALRALWSRA